MNCPACGHPDVRPEDACPACHARAPLQQLPPPAAAPPPGSTGWGPPPPPGYADPRRVPGPPGYAPHRRTAPLAIASFVLAMSGLVLCPIFAPATLLTALIAVATGHVAWSQIRRSNGALLGTGLAVPGLIIGYLQLAAACFTMLLGAGLVLFAQDIIDFVKHRLR